MSKGNVKNNSNGNSNSFLISKNQTSRFSAKSRASLTRTLYVSLDNADKVIEGGPFRPFFGLSGALRVGRASCRSFSLPRCPFAFYLHCPCATRRALAKTAPLPVLFTRAQATLLRVVMKISKLFHKLRFIANIEIVIALLPEMLAFADQSPRYSLFQ